MIVNMTDKGNAFTNEDGTNGERCYDEKSFVNNQWASGRSITIDRFKEKKKLWIRL